ncbi:hypothetical protein ACJMK2_013105 [Sinanodonta woodiana]|uniref:Cytochrome b5 heme-binding domain-containing protein n=1 Tax=Sinanodonta woodiana TaxID=1069815 RepID=A0ABD3VA32_SINWO
MAENNQAGGTFNSYFLYLFSLIVVIIASFSLVPVFHPVRDYVLNLMPFEAREEIIHKSEAHGIILTKAELAKHTGEDGGTIYLAILGKVFDVTKGRQHYGPAGSYSFFTGKDASRAFVSGDFTSQGLTDDVSGLSWNDVLGLTEWVEFYKKDYTHIGVVVGTFYDETGQPTEALKNFQRELEEAKIKQKLQDDDRKLFPGCNSEYRPGVERRLWCSNLSGGVKREWIGRPRQYFQAGQKQPRCACVKDFGPPSDNPDAQNHANRGDLDNPSMKVYEDCDEEAVSCTFPDQ